MGGKAKTQKHTAKEINMKHKAAKERAGGAGGGASGLENRKCQKVGVKCDVCLNEFLSFPDMRIHYDSRHPREVFPEEAVKEAFLAAKNKTAERRVGHQQGKLDYKHKEDAAKPAPAGGRAKAAADDLAALLSAGVAGMK
ncbi:hypothetical protein H257_07858 [Aphanomyces astaci]|uniref:C2H2-type domain-containing protein n=1 Tax=Aphanomyces astaci TaxID=112090 RepID=W4GJP1_APHAT|nr:hypothetical protein H257_07858 [Aphanomyces astaci]ETV79123.1 hypothetical protein H257_07858 [Aphanomyces astaci]KAF0745513.1 hypothetical protein AaE_008409 [Aphanomyces astaci]RHY07010.1 hypothetical protein DYB36_004992 [Aphanomyces astaci]RHY33254.1 hypothetical protein DYB25_010547 [Aphanomyces astaci]RHY37687.1 hypothetical protein DYB38_004899 [Aphanomyces astaci]|eukprot:XP_009831842.1 hypothetical protein H257_07858 [Aphanomyces astaci]